ncbi:hypothetical protein OAG1_21180 [Agarivorans sp. OAG1]|uniref:hypothetical protein n=1 Tax=Agarivorans sp. OAG1 TaxID=3082387 RepID=UPI002B2B260F|nr:hypothetical protein OAG1_21180 [Agarivorans sp. OAG1]
MTDLDINKALGKLVEKIDQVEGIVVEQGTAEAWQALDKGAKKLLSKIGVDAAELKNLFAFIHQVSADPSLTLDLEEWQVPLGSALSIKGRVGGHLIIDIVLPSDAEQYGDFKQPNMATVAIDQQLQIESGVSINLPVKLLNIFSNAEGHLKWQVKVVCAVAHDQKLIRFLGQLAKEALPLFSLESLSNVINAQYSSHAIQGVVIQQNRALSASATATLGHVWSVSGNNKLLDVKVNASAGASFKASYAFSGGFKLVIKPADIGVQISLYQLTNSTKQAGLSLDALIELHGLDKVAETYLAAPLEKLEAEAAQLQVLLERFKEPGTWLLQNIDEHFAQAISEEDWKDIALLLADGDSDGLANQLGATVKDKLELALTTQPLEWLSKPDETSQKIGDYLQQNTFLTPALSKRLKLNDLLTKNCIKAKQKLVEEIAAIADKSQGEVAPLLTPLKQLKEAKTELKDQLNKQQLASTLTDCVTRWLEQYNKARTTFSQAIKKAGELQLGLSVYGSSSKDSGKQAMLSFKLVEASATECQDLYQDLLLGKPINLDSLQLMERDGQLSDLSGWLVSSGKIKKEIGLKLNLGDNFQFSQQSLIEKVASAKVDHTGQLLELTGESVIRHQSKTLKESRTAEFVSAFDVLAALKFGASPNIGIGLSFEDKGVMTPKEMQQFLAPLSNTAFPLIDRTSYLLALQQFNLLYQSQSLSRSIIECQLNLDANDIHALAAANETDIEASAIELLCNMTLSGNERGQIAHESKIAEQSKAQLNAFLDASLTSSAPSSAQSSFKQLQQRVKDILANAHRLSTFIGIYRKLSQQIENLQTNDTKAYIKLVNQANDELIATMKSFIKVQGWFSGLFSEAIPKTTIILLIVLAKYLGRDEPLLTPVISYDSNGKTQVL